MDIASLDRSAFDLAAAPLSVGRVTLRVRDLDRVARFYEGTIGLRVLEAAGPMVRLGAGGRPLVELRGDPAHEPARPRFAGLFHLALRVPMRADLARWLRRAMSMGVALQGASDHGVSEALYLADPEGNGIEVYADRPVSAWRDAAGALMMPTEPLDLGGLAASAGDAQLAGLPEGTEMGHLHLRVCSLALAERHTVEVLGMEVSHRYPGGSFFAAGGYHHQLAANVWTSRGAAPRPEGMAGLHGYALHLRGAAAWSAVLDRAAAAGLATTPGGFTDPWGAQVALNGTPG